MKRVVYYKLLFISIIFLVYACDKAQQSLDTLQTSLPQNTESGAYETQFFNSGIPFLTPCDNENIPPAPNFPTVEGTMGTYEKDGYRYQASWVSVERLSEEQALRGSFPLDFFGNPVIPDEIKRKFHCCEDEKGYVSIEDFVRAHGNEIHPDLSSWYEGGYNSVGSAPTKKEAFREYAEALRNLARLACNQSCENIQVEGQDVTPRCVARLTRRSDPYSEPVWYFEEHEEYLWKLNSQYDTLWCDCYVCRASKTRITP